MYSKKRPSTATFDKCVSKSMTNLAEQNQFKKCPVYHGSYLGSAVLTNGKTGLGSLQDPLRELYCIYKERGTKLVQQRRLVITNDGITMQFNEMGIDKSVHTNLASVHDVMLLKLCFERKSNKQVYSAFVPVAGQYDLVQTNLYLQITKPYLKIINPPTPYIVGLIMRRSSGLQALECHVFIYDNLNEAKLITDRIRRVCSFDDETTNDFKHAQNNDQSHGFGIYENRFRYDSVRLDQGLEDVENERQGSYRSNNREKVHFHEQKRSKSISATSHKPSFFEKLKSNFKYKSKENLVKPYDQQSNYSAQQAYSPELHLKARKKNFNEDSVSLKSERKNSTKKLNQRPKSPTPSQYSSKVSNSGISRNAFSVADVDFRRKSKVFDDGLLIDNSTYALPLSRSATPLIKTNDLVHENRYTKQQRSQSVLGSPIRESVNLKDLIGGQRPVSALSERILAEKISDNASAERKNTIHKHDLDILESNHLVWNPVKRTPESLDVKKHRSRFECDQAHGNTRAHEATVYVNQMKNRDECYSPLYATRQYLQPNTGCYSQNSQNDDREQYYYTLRSSFYANEKSSKHDDNDFIYHQCEPTVVKPLRPNSKNLVGGVKVFPTMTKPDQKYKSQVMIPREPKLQALKVQKSYREDLGDDTYDDEVIDLTRNTTEYDVAPPKDPKVCHTPSIYNSNRYGDCGVREQKISTSHHDQILALNYRATPTQRTNYTYYINSTDEHFGGY